MSEKNFTSIEQSKRLCEMGVPRNSADCHYQLEPIGSPSPFGYEYMLYYGEPNEDDLPCWSVGHLIYIYLTCAVDDICDGCCAETPSLHIIQHDKDKLVSTIIKLMSEDDMDFSKLKK